VSGDFTTGEIKPLTDELKDGAARSDADVEPTGQNPDRMAAATAVADEPSDQPAADAAPVTQDVAPAESPVTAESSTATDAAGEAEAPAADAAGDAEVPAAAEAPAASEAPAAAEAPAASEATAASDTVAAEAPAATTDAPATPDEPASPADESAVGDVAVASTATMPLPPELDSDDTADAPTAAEDEEADEPVPAPRELGPEPTTMEELLAEQDSDIKSFKHGDVVEGTVVRIDKDEILVDIGAKSEGVVSNRELYGRHAESQPQLAIGDTVLVYVLQPESQEGHAVLSLRRAGLERKWRAMQEQFEAGVIIEAPVIDHNKGGLIVDCGIRGFVPISQIVDFPRRPQNDQPRDAAQEIAEKLMPFVGRKLRLKILEVNRKANRLILSEKVALYEERREKRDELFSSLQVGQKVSGTVRSIAPFGVFIDLGGIDGLVHKSELSWNKVNNPEAGYKVGDEVEAEVIDINHERGRISLSIRRLQPDPWHSTVADFKVGDVIDGTVTKLVNFGAFVRVRDGLEGLIHISELSHQRVAHPGDVVHEGQTLKLKIISLDSERHRLGLSLKQAEEPPARPAPEAGAAGATSAPRGERRPRPERGWSASDAVQEPEGGIDNTLAAAFAQVRDQLAASEEARVSSEDPAEAETAEATAAPETAEATAEPVDATAEPETAEAGAEPVEATAEPETAEAVAQPVDVTEPAAAEAPAATTTDAAEAEVAAVTDAQGDGEPATAEVATEEAETATAETAAEAEPTAEPEPAAEAAEPEAKGPADASTSDAPTAEADTEAPAADAGDEKPSA
jgi:small subunit ribosomal protein S1